MPAPLPLRRGQRNNEDRRSHQEQRWRRHRRHGCRKEDQDPASREGRGRSARRRTAHRREILGGCPRERPGNEGGQRDGTVLRWEAHFSGYWIESGRRSGADNPEDGLRHL